MPFGNLQELRSPLTYCLGRFRRKISLKPALEIQPVFRKHAVYLLAFIRSEGKCGDTAWIARKLIEMQRNILLQSNFSRVRVYVASRSKLLSQSMLAPILHTFSAMSHVFVPRFESFPLGLRKKIRFVTRSHIATANRLLCDDFSRSSIPLSEVDFRYSRFTPL